MLRIGAFEDLGPAELVSVLSGFVYEARKEIAPKIPRGAVENAFLEMAKCWLQINSLEEEFGLDSTREPDSGFSWIAYRWASGHSLSSILKGSEMTVGDFVRSMKQIIDLLRQLNIAAPRLQNVIAQAVRKVDRGVISYSMAVV